MKHTLKFFALLLCGFLASIGPSQAATPAEQVVSALAKGDFAAVQQIVTANPAQTGAVSQALLAYIHANLTTHPETAAAAMMMAASYGDQLLPPDAMVVAPALKQVVAEVADKALLVCNPDGDDQMEKTRATLSPEKQALAEAMDTLMSGAEALAATMPIKRVEPRLLDQIKAQTAQCHEGGSELFVQSPIDPRKPPYVNPVPRPPKKFDPSAE